MLRLASNLEHDMLHPSCVSADNPAKLDARQVDRVKHILAPSKGQISILIASETQMPMVRPPENC